MGTDEAFRRASRVVLIAVAIVFVLVGGLTAAFGTRSHDRVEGVAERWLTAVGDLTRKGVGTDARHRVADHGDPALVATFLRDDVDHADKSLFTALEVGKALPVRAGVALVPVKAVYRQAADGGTLRGSLILRKAGDSWRVVDVGPFEPAGAGAGVVPSDGGPAVTRAPLVVYAGALLIAVLVTFGAAALIRASGRQATPMAT